RRRHTRCLSDWSSDVCSSDLSRSGGDNEHEATRRLKTEFLIQWSSLTSAAAARTNATSPRVLVLAATNLPWAIDDAARRRFVLRSEERRVGKECRTWRWWY